MRCALVIPPWRPEDIFPAATARLQVNYWQPLGMLYLGAALARAGHEVRLWDGSFLTLDEILAEARAWRPGLVGIHANTFLWPRALATARAFKLQDPEAFAIAGGPHPTALGARALLEGLDCLDAVAIGEGEQTLPDLVEALAAGRDPAGVAGLVVNLGGAAAVTAPRDLVRDLDGLAFPARDLLGDPGLYLPPPGTFRAAPVATLMASRGCRNRCVYCFQLDPAREIRFRSVEDVLAEIELCLAQGYREIRFLDDAFTAERGRVLELCAGIRARGWRFPWFASSCVNQVDPELLAAMAEAGCWSILFGAESGVQRDLNALGKGSTPEQIRQAVAWAKAAGLHVVTPFLLGIPGQTRADVLATIAFACRLDSDVANLHAVSPFPGTALHERAAALGVLSDRAEDYTFQGFAFVPHTLGRQEMAELRALFFRRFYTRPRLMLKKLKAARSPADFKGLWLGLAGLWRLWTDKGIFRRGGRG